MRLRFLPLVLLLAAGPAAAIDLFLNGVRVTGALNGQTFRDVEVRVAGNGDVYIDAPAYRVEVEKPAAASALEGGKYWFFLEARQVGTYRTSVLVNGKPAVDVPASSAQWVADLGPHLIAGQNQVQVTFLPAPGAVSLGGEEAISILFGEGQKAADGTLTIGKVIQTLKVDGGKTTAEAWPLTFTLP